MARKAAFTHEGYGLGQVRGTAYAICPPLGERTSLGVPYGPAGRPTPEARQALISFVARVKRIQIEEHGITVGGIWDRYVALKEEEGKDISPMITNWNRLRGTFAHLDPADITEDLCRKYCRARFDTGVKQWTVWTEMNRLRTMTNWALSKKLIRSAPDLWLPNQGEAKDVTINNDEIVRLLDAASQTPHVHLFTLICLCSGARSGAVLELTWDRVDFDKREVDLRNPVHKADPMLKLHKKGRAVFEMNDTLAEALSEARALAETPWVIEYHGTRVRSIKKAFKRACQRAGLSKDVSPHVLRHTVATMLRDQKVPLEEVSRLLGHSETRTTEKTYQSRTAAQTSRAVSVLDTNVIPLSTARRKAS